MRDTVPAVAKRFEVVGGEGEVPDAAARVRALRTAYQARRLVISDDTGALARTRLSGGRAIDARDVAEAMLRELVRPSADRRARS